MPRYIECEMVCAEVDKGDLLVGNNAEFAKEVIYRTPTADVAPRSEVAREIFSELDEALAYALESHPFAIARYNEIKKKHKGDNK